LRLFDCRVWGERSHLTCPAEEVPIGGGRKSTRLEVREVKGGTKKRGKKEAGRRRRLYFYLIKKNHNGEKKRRGILKNEGRGGAIDLKEMCAHPKTSQS